MDKESKATTLHKTIATSLKLLRVLWREDKGLFLGNLLILIPGIVPFANAFIYAQLINLIVSSLQGHPVPTTQLVVLIAARLAVLLLQDATNRLQYRTNMGISTRIPLIFTQRLMRRISTLDVAKLEDSDFMNKLEDAKDNASWRISNSLQDVFYVMQELLQMAIAAVSLIFLNWIFAIIITLAALPTLWYQTVAAKAVWNIWSVNSPYRKRYIYLFYTLSRATNVKELKLFGLGGYFADQAKDIGEKFTRENMAALNKRFWFGGIADTVNVAGYAVVEIYMILAALARNLSLGALSYYTTTLFTYQNAVGGLFRSMASLVEDNRYVAEIFEVLDTEPTIVSPDPPKLLTTAGAPHIEFRHVTFAYPGAKTSVLNDFSLVVRPGEKVAFVGENGAGKTTIIKLLCRFYDVDKGEILIDGINIKDLDLVQWYERLGVLFQDFLKYEYTLGDNIRFGRVTREATPNQIAQAAAEAGADTVAANLKEGYDQMLGKTFRSGTELSGGQWQKVALARAFYRNAPVLVLDEPTASIDAKAEHEIFRRVEKLANDKTVFIISHRFSTVRNADKIYVIDGGKIVESGSHAQLMKKRGSYAALFDLQAAAYR